MIGQSYTASELAEINAANQNTSMEEQVDIQELLQRIAEPTATFDNQSYSEAEKLALKRHYANQNRAALADIIPNAGATETFAVAVGDFFYDPTDGTNGGPGGDCTTTSSGNPGDYPNCGCTTVTTLTGTDLAVEFLSFNIFGTFDILTIYDGPDTASPQIYDSNANSTADTLAGMIALNGSAVFESTSGALTFEFISTTVVNTCGWEAEVVTPGGGGGGGGTSGPVYAYDAGFCSDDFGTFEVGGPYNIATLNTFVTGYFAGDFDGNGDLYALNNDALTIDQIDTTTGVPTPGPSLTGLAAGHSVSGLAWNANDNTMYALSTNNGTSTVYTIDVSTGAMTAIGNTGTALSIWLAIDNNGNAYTADIADDSLYSVDLGTGAGTLVGALGLNINFAQDADFDPADGTLYMAAYIGGGVNSWASVDTTTGVATPLGTVNADCAELGIVAIEGAVVSNDECADAYNIECGDVYVGSTTTDTDSGGNPAPDEWFSYTGDGDAEFVTFSLCDGGTNYDSLLRVFDACGGNEIATNDDFCGLQSQLSFLSDGVTTYYLMVEGFGSSSGDFSLEVSCQPVAANDLCDNAIAVDCNTVVSGSTNFATIDDTVASNCDDTYDPTPFNPTVDVTAPGVWYSYEDASGYTNDIRISTCDTANFDTKISVYSGDCGALVCVAANDDNDDCSGFTSTVEFTSDGSSTYYILVHGFGTATGDFDLSIDCVIVPPSNDDIVDAIDIDEFGCPYTDTGVQMPGATEEAGTPTDCDITGANGVWYKFTPVLDGFIKGTITNPAGFSSVTFYTAPDENASETDLVLVDWFENQCLPSESARIPYVAGQAYYVFVVNTGATTDVVFDECEGTLGNGDETIEGFVMYPNPATDVINLRSADQIEGVSLYNILGQQVISSTVNATEAQVDVSALSTGTYIMKVTVNGELGTYKVIVE